MATRFNQPLFVISVAARLVKMHPQTLRKYEREGLIIPSRTAGNLRLYSDQDIELLRQVKYLVEDRGLNLAGVQLALELTRRLQHLQGVVDRTAHAGTRVGGRNRVSDPSAELCARLDDVLRLLGAESANERG